jgi:hypothetical protein
MAEPLDGLLAAVRNYLDITWVDAGGDTKLTGIISRGMKEIDGVAGKALDYTAEDKPRGLLLDYCLYARADALDDFRSNYLPDLLGLQNATMIADGIANAQLSALTIGALVFSPVFAPGVYEYTANTGNDSDVITATAVKAFADIGITANGSRLENGTAAVWDTGDNLVVVSVSYGGVTLTYKAIVTR